MKTFLAIFIFSTFALAAPQKSNRILPVTKEDVAVKKDKIANDKLKAIIKEEDCDDKAKKPVEIVPEPVSLGTAGCTLDETKP